MESNQKYIVETFIEADVTSADASRTCHASSSGVTGVEMKDATVSLADIARKAVRDNDRRGWLKAFLRLSADWDEDRILRAEAKYQVRATVHVSSTEGLRVVGECEFEEDRMALSE